MILDSLIYFLEIVFINLFTNLSWSRKTSRSKMLNSCHLGQTKDYYKIDIHSFYAGSSTIKKNSVKRSPIEVDKSELGSLTRRPKDPFSRSYKRANYLCPKAQN